MSCARKRQAFLALWLSAYLPLVVWLLHRLWMAHPDGAFLPVGAVPNWIFGSLIVSWPLCELFFWVIENPSAEDRV